ncbi:MAG TPA: hypothetical protein VFY58_06030 [Nocardioides sp.]|nr:hypothetical protein [Nocardioides sp.]
MSTTVRWAVAILTVVLVLCLLVWARGIEHRRGDEVGAYGIGQTLVGP